MKWVLLVAWVTNGTGFAMQEFETEKECRAAMSSVKEERKRSGPTLIACMNKLTGYIFIPLVKGES